MPDARTVGHAARQCQPGTCRPFGVPERPAMLRLLDHRDPGWRD